MIVTIEHCPEGSSQLTTQQKQPRKGEFLFAGEMTTYVPSHQSSSKRSGANRASPSRASEDGTKAGRIIKEMIDLITKIKNSTLGPTPTWTQLELLPGQAGTLQEHWHEQPRELRIELPLPEDPAHRGHGKGTYRRMASASSAASSLSLCVVLSSARDRAGEAASAHSCKRQTRAC